MKLSTNENTGYTSVSVADKISHEGVDVGGAEARRDDFIVPAQRGLVGNFVHQLNVRSERLS